MISVQVQIFIFFVVKTFMETKQKSYLIIYQQIIENAISHVTISHVLEWKMNSDYDIITHRDVHCFVNYRYFKPCELI